jgi:hypothetical protein
MAKKPHLRPGREIKEGFAAIGQMQQDVVVAIREVDAAIKSLPRGQDKRSLLAEQDELKRQSGLFPEHEPRRSPREDWPSERLAKAIELKDAARKWKVSGRLDKASKCLNDARAVEREAALRRAAERGRI